jgi:tRNA modification GTPase
VDTAGLREAQDHVERLGIDRSLRAIADADAVLLVVDGSSEPTDGDEQLRERLAPCSSILVVNKVDLGCVWPEAYLRDFAGSWPSVAVSALTGAGIGTLRSRIQEHILGDQGSGSEGLLITNARQAHCLDQTARHLEDACRALETGLSEEFILHDLRLALDALGEVTGETGVEEILGEIFSRFCVGK